MAKKAERGNWGNWLEFLFSCIGCLVGLGNIWRFPFVCYRSGGAAFLIPYFLAQAVCAIPMLFLEMSYSQYSNLGPGKVWIICPLFKGIGVGMIILTGILSCYYNVVIAWALFYLSMSFKSTLPWTTCNNEWNTPNCVDVLGLNYNTSTNITSIYNSTDHNISPISSTEEFWKNHVLDDSGSLENLGTVKWQLVVCLLFAWLCEFLCLFKGIKTSGKVVYVAATVPYLVLLALLIRGSLLPGALQGVQYYTIPRWEKLLQPKVWQDAAVQVFFSSGIGFGGLMTLASYNKFNNNCYRDAIMFPFIDSFTSWFAGFVIFVFLGYMAHLEGKTVDDVVASGSGLAFITYPQAVSTMPFPQIWSVLFFAMLFLVGMDSQFVHIQTITTGIADGIPLFGKTEKRKGILTGVVCLVGFLLGIPFTTRGGTHLVDHVDSYIATISIMALSVFEVIALSWLYGADRLLDDITAMIGYRPTITWKPIWLFILPTFILILWCFGLSDMHSKNHNISTKVLISGVIVGILPLIPIPLLAARELQKHKGSILQRIKLSCMATKEWKPVQHKVQEQTIETELPLL